MASRTREQIEELLKDYRNRGGMTRREFCQSRDISLSTQGYHLRRYESGAKVTGGQVREGGSRASVAVGAKLVFACAAEWAPH